MGIKGTRRVMCKHGRDEVFGESVGLGTLQTNPSRGKGFKLAQS
jgi:hypothetical protein